jgi:alpha-mannosidase
VCGHRWADLGEGGYGVALLNDCKYGYDIRGHVMRLSLLRSPAWPDPAADQGRHEFRYALLPHRGDFRAGRVIEEAEAFNMPLEVVEVVEVEQRVTEADATGLVSGRVIAIEGDGVRVEAVKRADRDDAVVVRLCEVHGGRRTIRVRPGWPASSAHRTDLLERETSALTIDEGAVTLSVRPFEVVTLSLR